VNRALGLLLAVTLIATPLAVAAAAEGRPVPSPAPRPQDRVADRAPVPGRSAPVQVGDLTLRPCDVANRALCGSIRRLWEPGNPAAGRVRVGFAFIPARDDSRPVIGTVVPHEGGPGYSTTDSTWGYRRMYGPLLHRRNMLLIDQRGTGLSEPLRCPALQDLKISYAVAAGRCGRSLGDRADDYSSAVSADDTAKVIERLGLGPVDLYGDSYGTFFQQVFAGRHPDLVRSVILDGAYPTFGESAWYPTQGPALRRAFTAACERSAACRDGGRPFLATLRTVLQRVRAHPWTGTAYNAEGVRIRVQVDPGNLVYLAYTAAYGPVYYRELTAALRSALDGDRAPLLRLVAETVGVTGDAGPVVAYSEGLAAAVTCHDYPQIYDMTAPPGRVRERQLDNALERRQENRPLTYAPFRVREYAGSDWEAFSWCTRWPTAPASNPAGPPRPPGGSYPDVPVLVLSGEMDSLTTPAEGDIVASQFPDARHVVLLNSFHVNASYDFEGCGPILVREFTRDLAAATGNTCADEIPPVRAQGRFPLRISDVPAGESQEALDVRRRRTAPAAALVVADVMDRWLNSYSGRGVGLRGGTYVGRGYQVARFSLDDVQLIKGQRVSGTAVWDRRAKTMVVDLRVAGRGPDGRLRGSWDTRAEDALAVLRGHLDAQHVRVQFPAP